MVPPFARCNPARRGGEGKPLRVCSPGMPPFRSLRVDDLRIADAADWRRAGIELLDPLVDVLRRDRVKFLVPRRPLGWDRIAFLNLTFWSPGGGELLDSTTVAADQLAHVAWHHLAARRL